MAAFVPAGLSHAGDEWWWCRNISLESIAESLDNKFIAIVDEFLPLNELQRVQTEVTAALVKGLLSHQGLTGGVGGADATAEKAVRGDLVGFFESKLGAAHDQQLKEGWGEGKAITRALEKMNTIVCELRDAHIPELKSVTTRSRAMVTCYPGEQRGYTKHCDNAVRNGRKLTAILYLNNDWTQADGGELKIYPSYTTEGSNVTRRLMLEGVFGYNPNNCFVTDNAIAIRPIANRLVLFWSNMRCPHEVLPTGKSRFAVTLWFIDGKERDETAATRATAATTTTTTATAAPTTGTEATAVSRSEVSGFEDRVGHQERQHEHQKGEHERENAHTIACCSPVPSGAGVRSCFENSLPSSVSLMHNTAGEATSWNASDRSLLYTIQFSDDSLVKVALVDVVNKNELLIHCASQEFTPIRVPIVLPCAINYSVQESKTTAKYSKKKKLLSVQLYFE